MSDLEVPRLHFPGWFQADASTINNDVRTCRNASPSVVPSCGYVRVQGGLS